MSRWWFQIPIIYWLSGKKKQQDFFIKLVDDFSGDIVRKRRKALEVSTPDEECMGIVDRFILSGEMSEREIKWDTLTLFTTVSSYCLYLAFDLYFSWRCNKEFIRNIRSVALSNTENYSVLLCVVECLKIDAHTALRQENLLKPRYARHLMALNS